MWVGRQSADEKTVDPDKRWCAWSTWGGTAYTMLCHACCAWEYHRRTKEINISGNCQYLARPRACFGSSLFLQLKQLQATTKAFFVSVGTSHAWSLCLPPPVWKLGTWKLLCSYKTSWIHLPKTLEQQGKDGSDGKVIRNANSLK